MPPSRRTGRLCPWCWPIGWKSRNLACPRRPLLCCTKPSFRRFLWKLCQFATLTFLIVILVLWMGMAYEQSQVRAMPDTESLYHGLEVCALRYNESHVATRTVANGSEFEKWKADNVAHNTTSLVAHCGGCGNCSTPHDILIYDQTKNTLFKESIQCAKHGLVGGHRAARRCLSERVGLSNDCNDCWAENLMCDLRSCIFTCFLYAIFSKGVHDGTASEELNRCTYCDEVRCGPAFLKCAGANRRRTAIQSDIERDVKSEVCASVDKKWWLNKTLQDVWEHEYKKNMTQNKRRKRIRAKRDANDSQS